MSLIWAVSHNGEIYHHEHTEWANRDGYWVLAHPAKTRLLADARSTAGLQSGCLALPLSSHFVRLFSAGRFFRKLESDLTVFEFQMSGKRPSLF